MAVDKLACLWSHKITSYQIVKGQRVITLWIPMKSLLYKRQAYILSLLPGSLDLEEHVAMGEGFHVQIYWRKSHHEIDVSALTLQSALNLISGRLTSAGTC